MEEIIKEGYKLYLYGKAKDILSDKYMASFRKSL
jgi:hypothetical protein